MNQFVSFAWFGATRSHPQCHSQSHVLKAFVRLWVERHYTINIHPKAHASNVIRLRWERVWRFLNTGGWWWWWWCRRGGWCRFLFHYLQYSPSWLSNVRRLAMNIEKVSWLHTMTQDLFWHWLLTSTAPSGNWLDSSLPGALCRQRNERRWAASWCWPQASVTTKTSCELSQMHQDAPGFWIKASLGLTIVRYSKQECRNGGETACCRMLQPLLQPTKLLLFIHSFAICWQPDKWQVLVQSPSLPWPGPQNQCV